MALSNFDKKTFTTASPAVQGRPYVDRWDRTSTGANYTINFSANTTSSGGWRNNPWYCRIYINGTEIKAGTVKNRTTTTIGTTEYYMSSISGHATGSFALGKNDTSVTIKVVMYDNSYSSVMGENSWTWTFSAATQYWNDVNVYNPSGVQDYLSGYFDLYTSEDNSWRYNLLNEDNNMTHLPGTYFQVQNIRPYYDYYELDKVTGYDSIPSSGAYRKTFDAANEVLGIYMKYKSYYLDLNGQLDGTDSGSLGAYGTAKVTVNGSTGSAVSDYYAASPYNYSYSIESITANSGYQYDGLASDSAALSGTIGTGKRVRLKFSTIKPSALSIARSSSTTSSISGSVSCTGINITNYTLYYKKASDSTYSNKSLGTEATWSLTGLDTDTNYNIYFTATNKGGTTTSSTVTYSTVLNNMSVTAPVVSNLLPFTCTVKSTGSITPSRDIYYLFSKDNGSTWVQKNRNLFNVSRWSSYMPSMSAGTVSLDGKNIKIAAKSTDSYTVSMHWTQSGTITDELKGRVGLYGFPVTPNTVYTFAYTPSNSTSSTQAYVHWYDSEFHAISWPGFSSQASSSRRVQSFTSPSDAAWCSLRFDNDSNGTTVDFQDIYFGLDSTGKYVAYSQEDGTCDWTDLNEETTYNFKTKVAGMSIGNLSHPITAVSSATVATTPADQAKTRIKKDGKWQQGKTYYKKDGTWQKVKKIYIKKDGKWVIGKNA